MLLWTVIVEEIVLARIDRVLVVAAENAEDAEELARLRYQSDGKSPERFSFFAQPVPAVPGPNGTLYRIHLRQVRLPRK